MSAIKVSWKMSKTFTIFAIVMCMIAIYFLYLSFILATIELKIAIGGLAVVFAAIAISSIRDLADKQKIDQILDKLSKIEDLQEEIQKEQNERASTGPPIVASLQAMSQYYMDYISKQKGEDKK